MFRTLLAIAALTAIALPGAAQVPVSATHPNGEVVLVVDFEVKPGFEAKFETAFARSTHCSRLEPGNVTFNIHRVVESPGHYVLYEVWRSTGALESHFQQPYTVALFAMFDRALVRPVTEGGLRYLGDLDPADRSPPVASDPASDPRCR